MYLGKHFPQGDAYDSLRVGKMHTTVSKSISLRTRLGFFCLTLSLCAVPAPSLGAQAVPATHTAHTRSTRRHHAPVRHARLRHVRVTPASATTYHRRHDPRLRQAHAAPARRHSIQHRVSPATEQERAAADAEPIVDAAYETTQAPIQTQPRIVPIPRYAPAPLRGSHDVLVHQNIIADVEGLGRIQNDAQIREMLAEQSLVALPVSATLQVDPRLPSNRRYCRPWTGEFLTDLAREHAALFHRPIQVNSAVRTVAFQRHLERINGNAAPVSGDTASPHLTGQAVDIGKKGMSRQEIGWMRAYLGQLQDAGKLDVEEEFQQACFHISVYETYDPTAIPSSNLVARADLRQAYALSPHPAAPRRIAVSHAPSRRYVVSHRRARSRARLRVVHHRRRRRHHVYAGMLAAGMR